MRNESSGRNGHRLVNVTLVMDRMGHWVDTKKWNGLVVFPDCNAKEPFLVHMNQNDLDRESNTLGALPEYPKGHRPLAASDLVMTAQVGMQSCLSWEESGSVMTQFAVVLAQTTSMLPSHRSSE